MINLINNISFNLINAELYSQCSNTAVGVYKVAKAKGDSATMERSMGYAGDMSAIANNAAGKIDDDLQEAIKKARAQEKDEAQKAKENKEHEATTEKSTQVADSTGDIPDVSTQEQIHVQNNNTVVPDISSSGSYTSSSTVETTQSSGTSVDIKV